MHARHPRNPGEHSLAERMDGPPLPAAGESENRIAGKCEPMTASDYLPQGRGLRTLEKAARDCHGCELWRDATQTVFGEGGTTAELMLVGEQPGDREDVEGAPFVGPAGQLLDRALEAAGIAREGVYVTNAVKHFKWRPKGTRRQLPGRTDERRALDVFAVSRLLAHEHQLC